MVAEPETAILYSMFSVYTSYVNYTLPPVWTLEQDAPIEIDLKQLHQYEPSSSHSPSPSPTQLFRPTPPAIEGVVATLSTFQ